MDPAMRLETPANGIIYTCVGLRGSGSLLEISEPSNLEERLKGREREGRGRGESPLIKLDQSCTVPQGKEQGLVSRKWPC